jgi:hypothetical protein
MRFNVPRTRVARNAQLERLWINIRKLKKFTSRDLQQAARAKPDVVKQYLRALTFGGYLEKKMQGEFTPAQYSLIKDNGVHRPVLTAKGDAAKPSSCQKMWVAIRVLKLFSYRDISLTAEVTNESARRYLRDLQQAGYLTIRKAEPHAPTLYSFLNAKDTGPHAPQVVKGKVFDHNLKKVVFDKKAKVAA